MADVNVNDGLVLADSVAASGPGSIISLNVISKHLEPNDDNALFAINAYIGASGGYEQIKAAPGSGQYIVVTKVSVICADKVTVRIGSGEGGGWVENVIWGPLSFNTEATAAGYKVGEKYDWPYEHAVKLPVNTPLGADVSSTASVLVMVEGFVI